MIRKLLFKNFILLHRGSQWLRAQFTRSGLMLLTVMVGAAIFGIDTRQTHAYQIFSFLFCLFILAVFSTFFLRGMFRVKRDLPEYGTVGQKLMYRLNISNQGGKNMKNLLVHDQLKVHRPSFGEFLNTRDIQDRQRNIFDRIIGYPRLANLIRKKRGADIEEAGIDEINAHSTYEKNLELLPLRRGYIYFDNSVVARTDPLGLRKKQIKISNPGRLLILPRCYRVPDILLGGSRKYQPGGLNLSTSVGDSEEFFSLRDYRPGDPVRHIHWRSYARRGEPVIKEFQDEFFSRMGLVLDTCINNQPDYLFEDAVSVASSIILANRQQDALLDLLLVNNEAFRMPSGRGLADAENMLEVLACVEYSDTENFTVLADLVNMHATDTSGFILVLLQWDEIRRKLVSQLRAVNIPLLVIIISDTGELEITDEDPMADQEDRFWILRAGDIQQSLDRHHTIDYAGKR